MLGNFILCIITLTCVHSWNLGPVHIISLSTEVYFYLEFGLELLFKQYEWLRKDLEVNNTTDHSLFSSPHSIFPHPPSPPTHALFHIFLCHTVKPDMLLSFAYLTTNQNYKMNYKLTVKLPLICVSSITQEANRPENRALRPWIITMGHRPMYCSDDDQDDCTKFDSYVRHR